MHHDGTKAEAHAEIPAPTTKGEAKSMPGSVWLTVGILATDGFVLQLRLKKLEEQAVRNKATGVWHIYHPAGGALTVKTNNDSTLGAQDEGVCTT